MFFSGHHRANSEKKIKGKEQTPLIPALRKQRQGELYESGAILIYILSEIRPSINYILRPRLGKNSVKQFHSRWNYIIQQNNVNDLSQESSCGVESWPTIENPQCIGRKLGARLTTDSSVCWVRLGCLSQHIDTPESAQQTQAWRPWVHTFPPLMCGQYATKCLHDKTKTFPAPRVSLCRACSQEFTWKLSPRSTYMLHPRIGPLPSRLPEHQYQLGIVPKAP